MLWQEKAGALPKEGGAALMAENKRHRVQLSFSGAGFQELIDLGEAMGVTRQDLFRYALRWLQWTFEETSKGGKIQIKEPGGEVKEVVAPFLPHEGGRNIAFG